MRHPGHRGLRQLAPGHPGDVARRLPDRPPHLGRHPCGGVEHFVTAHLDRSGDVVETSREAIEGEVSTCADTLHDAADEPVEGAVLRPAPREQAIDRPGIARVDDSERFHALSALSAVIVVIGQVQRRRPVEPQQQLFDPVRVKEIVKREVTEHRMD